MTVLVLPGGQLRCDGPDCPGLGPDALITRTIRGELCARCYRVLGEPPAPPSTMAEEHAALVVTRDRMIARGGSDRHMVRSGKAGV